MPTLDRFPNAFALQSRETRALLTTATCRVVFLPLRGLPCPPTFPLPFQSCSDPSIHPIPMLMPSDSFADGVGAQNRSSTQLRRAAKPANQSFRHSLTSCLSIALLALPSPFANETFCAPSSPETERKEGKLANQVLADIPSAPICLSILRHMNDPPSPTAPMSSHIRRIRQTLIVSWQPSLAEQRGSEVAVVCFLKAHWLLRIANSCLKKQQGGRP